MKQHITIEQLKELSESDHRKLIDWAESKGFISGNNVLEFFSIGRMLEFLVANMKQGKITYPVGLDYDIVSSVKSWGKWYQEMELCDALWNATKEVLEKGVLESAGI